MIHLFNTIRNVDQIIDIFKYREDNPPWDNTGTAARLHLISIVSVALLDSNGSISQISQDPAASIFRKFELFQRIGLFSISWMPPQTPLNQKITILNAVSTTTLLFSIAVPQLQVVYYVLSGAEALYRAYRIGTEIRRLL